ncbi:MAG: hypothetical protein R3275_09595 [Saprospiraceae bacterium]|nr:hypothetical protein [Saprospiraceae bacterium]
MIKILTIAILAVILYRLIYPRNRIERPEGDQYIDDDDEYVDYEEMD